MCACMGGNAGKMPLSPWNEALRKALVVFIYRKGCTLMFCFVQIKPSLKLGLGLGLGLGLFPWKGKGVGLMDR